MKNKSLIFAVCYISYTLIYVARLNLSMAAPQLKNGGVLSAAQIGLLGSVFFVVYAVGRLINGALSERFPARNMIAGGLLLGALANIFFGFLPPFAALTVLWGVNAYAQSMLWSSVLKTVGAVYGESRAQKMSAYMVTSVATGNIAGIIIAMLLIRFFGAAAAFILPGALLAVSAAAAFFIIGKPDKCAKGTFSGTQALKNKEVRFMALPAVFHGVMKDNISLWMAVYIADKFGIDIEKFAFYLLLIPIAGLAGRFLYPPLYKLLNYNENRVSFIGFCFVRFFHCCSYSQQLHLLRRLFISAAFIYRYRL